jgi:hypothetical protein
MYKESSLLPTVTVTMTVMAFCSSPVTRIATFGVRLSTHTRTPLGCSFKWALSQFRMRSRSCQLTGSMITLKNCVLRTGFGADRQQNLHILG